MQSSDAGGGYDRQLCVWLFRFAGLGVIIIFAFFKTFDRARKPAGVISRLFWALHDSQLGLIGVGIIKTLARLAVDSLR